MPGLGGDGSRCGWLGGYGGNDGVGDGGAEGDISSTTSATTAEGGKGGGRGGAGGEDGDGGGKGGGSGGGAGGCDGGGRGALPGGHGGGAGGVLGGDRPNPIVTLKRMASWYGAQPLGSGGRGAGGDGGLGGGGGDGGCAVAAWYAQYDPPTSSASVKTVHIPQRTSLSSIGAPMAPVPSSQSTSNDPVAVGSADHAVAFAAGGFHCRRRDASPVEAALGSVF